MAASEIEYRKQCDGFIQAVACLEAAYRSLMSAAAECPSFGPIYSRIARSAKTVRSITLEAMNLAVEKGAMAGDMK